LLFGYSARPTINVLIVVVGRTVERAWLKGEYGSVSGRGRRCPFVRTPEESAYIYSTLVDVSTADGARSTTSLLRFADRFLTVRNTAPRKSPVFHAKGFAAPYRIADVDAIKR